MTDLLLQFKACKLHKRFTENRLSELEEWAWLLFLELTSGQVVAVYFIRFWISAHIAYMKSMLFGRTPHDTMRELEAQHPLVSGWKPNFNVLDTKAKAKIGVH